MSEEDSHQEQAVRRIRHYVWSGFYLSESIEHMVLENEFPHGVLDADWVRNQIDREFAAKLEQQLGWADRTDCDRLDDVFAQLEKLRLIALQNAGTTQSEGMEDMSAAWYERGAEKSGMVGYCFYHGQDMQRAMEGKGLHLTYGDIGGDDLKGVAVGELVCRLLAEYGLPVEWDREIKTRLCIPKIHWLRRTPDY